MEVTTTKKRFAAIKWQKLIGVSLLIGFLAAMLAISLKHLTEHYESIFFERTRQNAMFVFIFPILGLSMIYLLKKYLFKNKENKGIREIYDSLAPFGKLPMYKIPSHFANGLLTVIFGGSTGIEVSTVVASAAVGSAVHEKQNFFGRYRKELICAGIAAGVTALFNSPLAGLLFTFEVISRKKSAELIATVVISSLTAWAMLYTIGEHTLLNVSVSGWHYSALPYFGVLAVFAALNSVYLTRTVLFFKKFSTRISNVKFRIALGAFFISLSILVLPQLYGDGYHSLVEAISSLPTLKLTISVAATAIGILILKPIITSITLSSGGDGGVFAPSLITGAFAGLLIALVANTFFNADVIPINFMLIGMAAVLSATIHAPLTAVFVVCGLSGNYVLILPLLAVCLLSAFIAKRLYPFTVYTYKTAN